MGCGCGSRRDVDWDTIRRILEESDSDNEEAPIEITEDDDVFSPARKREEVEAA